MRPNERACSRLDGQKGSRRALWRQACAGVLFAGAFASLALDGLTAPHSAEAPPSPFATHASPSSGQSANQGSSGGAGDQRKKQISAESTQLLAMAMALKAEVDKTNKDVLSINVIRKADEIERLAHNVKEKIKQTSGPS